MGLIILFGKQVKLMAAVFQDDDDFDEARDSLDDLIRRNQELVHENGSLKEQVAHLEHDVEESLASIEQSKLVLSAENQALKEANSRSEQENAALTQTTRQLETQLSQTKVELKKQQDANIVSTQRNIELSRQYEDEARLNITILTSTKEQAKYYDERIRAMEERFAIATSAHQAEVELLKKELHSTELSKVLRLVDQTKLEEAVNAVYGLSLKPLNLEHLTASPELIERIETCEKFISQLTSDMKSQTGTEALIAAVQKIAPLSTNAPSATDKDSSSLIRTFRSHIAALEARLVVNEDRFRKAIAIGFNHSACRNGEACSRSKDNECVIFWLKVKIQELQAGIFRE